MAGHSDLRTLKKRLQSISTAHQLSSAMKTVSAAKYSRCSRRRAAFSAYAAACEELTSHFGSELDPYLSCKTPSASPLFVVFSSNRGLCGGYNSEILSFADEKLRSVPDALVISCGKRATAHFAEIGVGLYREIVMPDVPEPDTEEFRELFRIVYEGFTGGEFSSVTLIYQKFRNMLSHEPVAETVLPLSQDTAARADRDAIFCFPDRDDVLKTSAATCLRTVLYSRVLDAAAGAQAATLTAMRTACDNAEETERRISVEISRMRQSAITSGVIETSSDSSDR